MATNSFGCAVFHHGYEGDLMRCLACDCNLSDREANRKYENWQEIKNPESRYIMLCDDCIVDTDLTFYEDSTLSNDNYEDVPGNEDFVEQIGD
jgi:hypothetical protein